ncbi:MAG: YihY family inner membrane protein [Oligoflexia bacterium]|nr:YihY family inner membrane protein [Oligoflexia bacterium]
MKKYFQYYKLWRKHQISLRSAALTYVFILSIVPIFAISLSFFSLVFDSSSYSLGFKNFLMKHLTIGTGSVIIHYIDGFLSRVEFKSIGYIGFLVFMIIALIMLSHIEDAINRVWGIEKKKALWKRFFIYNALIVLGPISVSISLANLSLVSKIFPHLIVKLNIAVILINAILLGLSYKVFPNCKVKFHWAILSGLLTALLVEAAKYGYAVYMVKALQYNKIYGGLAAIPLFLVWIYINWMLFLNGALLTYVLQNGLKNKET